MAQIAVRPLLDNRGAAFMAASEREKMIAGDWYACIDPELEEMRVRGPRGNP